MALHYERGAIMTHNRYTWCDIVIRSTTKLAHIASEITCEKCRERFDAYLASPKGQANAAKRAANLKAMEERQAKKPLK